MADLEIRAGSGGPLQLEMDPGGGASLAPAEEEALQLAEEEPQEITIRIGGSQEMTLNVKRSITEKLNLGHSFPAPSTDYNPLKNKPRINGVELQGDKTSRQLKIKETDPLTNLEIEDMLNTVFG